MSLHFQNHWLIYCKSHIVLVTFQSNMFEQNSTLLTFFCNIFICLGLSHHSQLHYFFQIIKLYLAYFREKEKNVYCKELETTVGIQSRKSVTKCFDSV